MWPLLAQVGWQISSTTGEECCGWRWMPRKCLNVDYQAAKYAPKLGLMKFCIFILWENILNKQLYYIYNGNVKDAHLRI